MKPLKRKNFIVMKTPRFGFLVNCEPAIKKASRSRRITAQYLNVTLKQALGQNRLFVTTSFARAADLPIVLDGAIFCRSTSPLY